MFFFKVINGALIVLGVVLMACGFYGMAMESQGYWGSNLVPGVNNATGFVGVGVLGLFVMFVPCIGYNGAIKKESADPEQGSGKCEILIYLFFLFFSIGMQMGFALVVLNSVGMLDSVKGAASNYTGAKSYIKKGEKATQFFVQQGYVWTTLMAVWYARLTPFLHRGRVPIGCRSASALITAAATSSRPFLMISQCPVTTTGSGSITTHGTPTLSQ